MDDGEDSPTHPLELPSGAARLRDFYRDGLLQDSLPFWLEHCIDKNFGGYMMALSRDGQVVDTDKGVWQQGRFAWLLGKLYNTVEKNPVWFEAAEHGIQFLQEKCIDPLDGRMWFHLTQAGLPIRKRRYAFSESFAAIAMAQYAKAADSQPHARLAIRLAEQFIQHNMNPPLELAKFEETRPAQSIGFPMITIATAQELREAIDWEAADAWIDFAIERIEKHFVKDDLEVVMETVGPGGEIIDHFDGRTLNPGHAIEGAWFILREGKHRNDSRLVELGLKMLRWMWRRGWDRDYGGMLYFVDLYGGEVQEYWHDMKFWWPHNETIIATLLAYLLTGDGEFAQMHRKVHQWSYEHFADSEHGEWFGYLHRDGRRSSTLKGNLWKGPFHFPRMQLVCWQLLEEFTGQRLASS
ncbi:MAG: AGE family epimerase/isomerase [Planctomycetota bacterium]